MKRKIRGIFLSIALLCLLTCAAMAAGVQAKPTNSVVYVNGVRTSFDAYTIGGNNYFKLRDLAMVLKDTGKEFAVGYDSASGMVSIDTQGTYIPVGGELSAGNGQAKTAVSAQSSFRFIGADKNEAFNISLGAYNIGGNNFVKLRDLMQWVDVGVGYDAKTAAITITTHQSYDLPKNSTNPLVNAVAMEAKIRGNYGNTLGTIAGSSADSVQSGKYYFVLDGWKGVYRYNIDGTGAKLLTGDKLWIDGNLQAYDGKLYYESTLAASGTSRAIWRMNFDGSGRQAIVKGTVDQQTPHNFIIYKGKMYARTYENDGGQHIVVMNLDGSGRKTLYSGDMICGGAMGKEYDDVNNFLISNDRIFFLKKADGNVSNLMSINLTGGDQKLHGKFSGYATLLYMNDSFVFYKSSNSIYRTNLDGKNRICIMKDVPFDRTVLFYGDKVLYETWDFRLGIMNYDGTGRSLMPNTPTKNMTRMGVFGVMDVNRTYVSFFQTDEKGTQSATKAFVNNDPKKPGYVTAEYSVKDQGSFPCWRPSSAAFPEGPQAAQSYRYAAPADGYYELRPFPDTTKAWAIGANSTKDNEPVIIWDVSGKDNQAFYLSTKNNRTTMQALHSGKQLGSSNEAGKALVQNGTTTDGFFFVDAGSNTYNIISDDGYYLGSSAGKYNNGNPIITWTPTGSEDQRFVLVPVEVTQTDEPAAPADSVAFKDVTSGTYTIAALQNEERVMDISGGSKDDGAKLIVWSPNGGDNQKFILAVDGDKCTITVKGSGKHLVMPDKKGGAVTQSGSVPATVFYIVDSGNGAVRFKTADGYYLSLSEGKTEQGTGIISWTKSDLTSQDFVLKRS